MKFYEFGTDNNRKLLLIHGMSTTWKMSFGEFIEKAQGKFHIIAVALDGHNLEEDTELISVVEEAQKLESYLLKKHNGEVEIIYGASLGGTVVFHMLMRNKVKVTTAICDGTMMLNYGILAKPMAKFMASVSSKMAKGEAKFMMKLMGIESKEVLEQKMYTGASKTTIYNSCMGCYAADIPENYSDATDIHLWYGSKETEPPKFATKLKKRDAKVHIKVFENYGHGSLLEYPDELLREIMRASKEQ